MLFRYHRKQCRHMHFNQNAYSKEVKHKSQFDCRYIFIAQKWPRTYWYIKYLQSPIKLPLKQNLLFLLEQPLIIQIQKSLSWQLEMSGFHEKLDDFLEHHWDRAHIKTTLWNFKDIRNRSICSYLISLGKLLSHLHTSRL